MAIGLNHNTEIIQTSQEMFMQVGSIFASARIDRPDGFLICSGDEISRTTYSRLFNAIVPNKGTVTISIQSPGMVTDVAHGFQTGESIFLTTTGALPTGLSQNILYFVINVTNDTFRLATTYANAIAGTAINTSGTQSGTHTIFACPYGLGNGSTTFNLPDLKSATLRGRGTSTGYTQNVAVTLGTKTNDSMQPITGSMVHVSGLSVFEPINSGSFYGSNNVSYAALSNSGSSGFYPYVIYLDSGRQTRTANETRMKNLGINFFIKF